MGVPNLLPLLRNWIPRRHISQFKGSIVAVDMSCYIAKGICIYKNAEDTAQFVMNRIDKLLEAGIIPMCVFDGPTPKIKEKEVFRRFQMRQKYRKFIIKSTTDEERKGMSKTSEFSKTVQILRESLHEKRITNFFAASEADPQCAFVEKTKLAHVVMTEDSDLIHLGCKRVLFKTDGRGWGEYYYQKDVKQLFRNKTNKFKRLQLLCSVLGNDYNKRIKGMGPKTSLRFINGLDKPNKMSIADLKDPLKKFIFKTKMVQRKKNGVSYSVKQLTIQNSAKKFMKKLPKADFATNYPVVVNILKMVHTRLNEYDGEVPEKFKDIAGKIETDKRIVVQTTLGNYGPDGPSAKRPEFQLRPRDCDPPYPDTCPWSANFQPPQNEFILHELGPDVPKDEKPSRSNPICSFCNKGFCNWSYVKFHQAIHTGEKLYKCKTCGSAFLSQHHLKRHVKIGHGKNHQCYRCYKKFTDVPSLIAHEELDDCTPPIYRCEYCDKQFSDLFKRHIHHQVVHPRVIFTCIVCDTPFSTQDELDEHLKIHAGNKAHGCFECGQRFEQVEELKTHFSSCHPSDKKYECLFKGCGMEFEKRSALAKHGKQHGKNESCKYKCVYCHIDFKSRGFFLQHIQKHSKCEICEHQFEYPYQLDKHLKYHSKCECCQKQFNNALELAMHMKSSHESESLFRCKKCHVVYTNQIHLDLHYELTGHNKRKIKCKECGKKYLHKRSLAGHLIIHKGTYKCNKCDYAFRSQFELKRHAQIHNISTKSFKCDRCPKTFNTKEKLDGHLKRTHDAVRKFGCTICDKFFVSLSIRNQHIQHVHPDKLLICPLCKLSYKTKRSLKEHTEKVHSPNSKPKEAKPVKEFGCELCPKSFRTKRLLHEHVKFVHGPKSLDRFQCVFCNREFGKKCSVAAHVRKSHPEKIENNLLPQPYALKVLIVKDIEKEANKTSNFKYECSFCDKKYVAPGGVLYHAEKHHPEEFKKSSSINYLATKINIEQDKDKENNEPLMLRCLSCNKTFKLNIEMKKHKCAPPKAELKEEKNTLGDYDDQFELITID